MARAKSEDEQVTMTEAARRLGMTQQAVGVWAAKSDAPVVTKGGRRYALWPTFPAWHREQITRPTAPADLEEAKSRKMAAEAELAEYELAQARGEFIAVADLDAKIGPVFDTFRAKLLAIPGRLAPRVVACRDIADARDMLEQELGVVLAELSA